jgi:hypothetical protein
MQGDQNNEHSTYIDDNAIIARLAKHAPHEFKQLKVLQTEVKF